MRLTRPDSFYLSCPLFHLANLLWSLYFKPQRVAFLSSLWWSLAHRSSPQYMLSCFHFDFKPGLICWDPLLLHHYVENHRILNQLFKLCLMHLLWDFQYPLPFTSSFFFSFNLVVCFWKMLTFQFWFLNCPYWSPWCVWTREAAYRYSMPWLLWMFHYLQSQLACPVCLVISKMIKLAPYSFIQLSHSLIFEPVLSVLTSFAYQWTFLNLAEHFIDD